MSQTPTPEALAAAKRFIHEYNSDLAGTEELARDFDAHTKDLQATIARLTRELGEARAEGARAMQDRAINHCKASAHNTRLDVIIERYGDEATAYAADLLNAVADELSRVDPIAIARHEHRKELSHD